MKLFDVDEVLDLLPSFVADEVSEMVLERSSVGEFPVLVADSDPSRERLSTLTDSETEATPDQLLELVAVSDVVDERTAAERLSVTVGDAMKVPE